MRELLLVQINGRRYAVGNEEVADVRSAGVIHRLPLSPAWMAGIALVDGRTVTVADLAACLGHDVMSNSDANVLVLKAEPKIGGFLVSGAIDACSVPDDALLPLPDGLSTDIIGYCARFGDAPVPLIDLSRLCRQLLEPALKQAKRANLLESALFAGQEGSSLRLFSIGHQLYAAPVDVLAGPSLKPGAVAELPQSPPFVRGVAIQDDKVLPVIDLSGLLGGMSGFPEQMLLSGSGHERFGLLVDRDLGKATAGNLSVSELPPLARSRGLHKAALLNGEIIPLVELPLLLSHESDAQALPVQYTPDQPSFSARFFHEDLEVVEFSLLGARYAIPKAEVEDIVPFRPYRPMPNTIPIVVGVAEHQETLLPVLDPGLIFGRQSPVASEWSMILLKNGDFRAFVLTERVFAERSLPREVQRELPILLPYPVIYGCYPESTGVRLILNVMELTLHFEKAEMQELLPSLVPERGETPVLIEQELMSGGTGAGPAGSAPTVEEEVLSGGSQATISPPGAMVSNEQKTEAATAATEQHAGVEEEKARVVQAEAAVPEEPVERRKPEQAAEAPITASEEITPGEDVNTLSRVAHPESADTPAAVTPCAESGEETTQTSGSVPVGAGSTEPAKSGRRSFLYGALAIAAVVAIFVLFGKFPKSEPSAPPRPSPVTREVAGDSKPQPLPKKPTLELLVPANMPVSMDTYVVAEGDTLWSISERFTGSPYNYPKIAGENRIADPDLIFPGQKIRLIKQ